MTKLVIVFALTLIGLPASAASIDQCKDALLNWAGTSQHRKSRIAAGCDSLPRASQDRAAALASKQDGMLVFVPPYQIPKDASPQVDNWDLKQVQAAAWKGDYQAIRNLAFGYASMPMKGQAKDPVQACAWYQALQFTGNPKLDVGDYGNAWVFCKELTPMQYSKAAPLALAILKKLPRSW